MADSAVIYRGNGFSSKGDKGRYVLPASFRKLVTESSRGENSLCVTQHHKYECLIGFGTSYFERLDSEIDRDEDKAIRALQPFDRAARDLVFGNVSDVGYDNSGRLILPAHLRGIVGIDEHVYFHASREIFLMWAPHVLDRQEGPEWAVAKAACAGYMATAKAGK